MTRILSSRCEFGLNGKVGEEEVIELIIKLREVSSNLEMFLWVALTVQHEKNSAQLMGLSRRIESGVLPAAIHLESYLSNGGSICKLNV